VTGSRSSLSSMVGRNGRRISERVDPRLSNAGSRTAGRVQEVGEDGGSVLPEHHPGVRGPHRATRRRYRPDHWRVRGQYHPARHQSGPPISHSTCAPRRGASPRANNAEEAAVFSSPACRTVRRARTTTAVFDNRPASDRFASISMTTSGVKSCRGLDDLCLSALALANCVVDNSR
jgi:hypothetical protein